jgi:hypothetical protein
MKLAPLPRTFPPFLGRSLTALTVVGAGLCGCKASDQIHGVDVVNKTGQILNVTYLDVAGDGTTRPYATTTLAKNGTCTAKSSDEEYDFGKRVRFSIPDRSPEDLTSQVELKLADDMLRDYDLVIVNGRLVAREHGKGRPGRQSETPVGQN